MSQNLAQSVKWIILTSFVLILGFLGFSYRGMLSAKTEEGTSAETVSHHEKPSSRYIPVNAVTLEQVTEYESEYQYTGKVSPRRRSQLGFEVGGRIDQLMVDDGDVVYEKQVLGILEKDRLKNRMDQLIAQKDQAEAVLKQMQTGRKEDKETALAQIRELEAEAKRLDLTLNRQKELLQKNVITKESYEQTYYTSIAIKEKLNSAQQGLLKIEQGGSMEEKLAQEANVRHLAETIKGIEIDLADCELMSPFSGRIVRRMHDEGEVISSGIPVFEIIETSVMEIRIGVPVSVIQQMKLNNNYKIKTNHSEFECEYKKLIPEIDPKTRTQTVILQVNNDQAEKLTAEEIVKLLIREKIKAEGFWVPTSALTQAEKGLWACYVLVPVTENNRKETNKLFETKISVVETLYVEGTRTLVRGTIKHGDKVVSSGVMKMVHGQIVELID